LLPLIVAYVVGTISARADQVILDDLIVDGSACIGIDCANGESFGFDTIRLKENNLRIKAMDTSSSASFPSNDWQITFNESSNGGANKFSIDDIDGGKTPFTIEAGAPSHSLYVDDGGRIGFGTSTPVVDLHVVSGNTPTLRLEQDGSSGFTPQTWDLAGNETNFFIRDATNGSTLPFRIQPGASSNVIYVANDDQVGINTTSPDNTLHVRKASAGSVTGGVNSPLVVENDTFCFINLLSPNTVGVGVAFGDPEAVASGLIQYSHVTDGMSFSTNGVERMSLDNGGNLVVTGSYAVGATTLNVPDYVFEPDYELMPIDELDRFVRHKKHLPGVPSAQEVKSTGSVNMTQMQMRLLEKVEELTLYTIDQQKTIDQQRAALDELRQRLGRLEAQQ
jgi:hypothetical protein